MRSSVILRVILLLACVSTLAQAQTARQIAAKTFPSVVLLVMLDANSQPISLGSGFFVSEEIIATNLHVIEGAVRGYAKLVGQKSRYDIVGTVGIDEARDLALLAVVGAKGPWLPLGESSRVGVGDEIYAVGNPQGLEGTFSQGIVSSVRRVGSDTLFQITAPISPGSSGGPILNHMGEVVGVAVATFKGGQNLNFAIPADYLASMLANKKPVAPLSGRKGSKLSKSIFDNLGERTSDAIVASHFSWVTIGGAYREFWFSLRNELKVPVKNIHCRVTFYDRYGRPVHYEESIPRFSPWHKVIRPGLALRYHFSIDDPNVRNLTAKIEVRVLNFQIGE